MLNPLSIVKSDFGMRAVKSVLVAAGQLKRKEPETNEDILLIRAMRDSNVPKFLEQDLPLFGGILSDLFPGIRVPFVDYGKLQTAVEKTLDALNLQRVPIFITKVIQVCMGHKLSNNCKIFLMDLYCRFMKPNLFVTA